MIRQMFRRLHSFVDLRSDRRYCEAHRQNCPSAGGGYFTFSRLYRAWLCKDALAKKARSA